MRKTVEDVQDDEESAVELLRGTPAWYVNLSHRLRCLPRVATIALARDPTLFATAPSSVRSDAELALLAQEKWASAIEAVPPPLRADPAFVHAMWCAKPFDALALGAELRADDAFVRRMLVRDGRFFQVASRRVRADPAALACAMRTWPAAAAHAEPGTVSAEILDGVLRTDRSALVWLRPRVDGDASIVRRVVAHHPDALRLAAVALRATREVVEVAVRADGLALRFAAPALCDDVAMCALAVARSGGALQYASPRLRADRELVLQAVRTSGAALEHASVELRADAEVVHAALASDGTALRYAAPALRACAMTVQRAMRSDAAAFEFAQGDVLGDPELALKAVRRCGGLLRRVRAPALADERVLRAAVAADGAAVRFVPPARLDTSLAHLAVTQCGRTLALLPVELRRWRPLVRAAVADDPHALQSASAELRDDEELVLLAVRRAGDALRWASPRLRGDEGVVRVAVSQNGDALCFVTEALQANVAVVQRAVRSRGEALRFAHVALRRDEHLAILALQTATVESVVRIVMPCVLGTRAWADAIARRYGRGAQRYTNRAPDAAHAPWLRLSRGQCAWRRLRAHVAFEALVWYWYRIIFAAVADATTGRCRMVGAHAKRMLRELYGDVLDRTEHILGASPQRARVC